jgi:thiol-disulfide isomerase/thioredoxin
MLIVVGVIILGIVGAGLILFLQPKPMDGITMPTFSIGGKKQYVEIAGPAGFVNTPLTSAGQAMPITLGELIGKKVILVDFMTYSCINCQRTFPYMVAWYDKYKDQGLEIVGIHTPEFAFEKDIDNVREAMEEFGITYPVVLDNDYATWRAYGNQYWPRKYLIDIEGNIVYDHIGEGGYVETEEKIQELLAERAKRLGESVSGDTSLAAAGMPEKKKYAQSPEVYFGSDRNEFLVAGRRFVAGVQSFTLPNSFVRNALYLGGSWNIQPEYAESQGVGSIVFRYSAQDVYFVASSDAGVMVEILQDGKSVGAARGADVGADGTVHIRDERLYKLIRNPGGEEHVLEIRVKGKGLRAFTLTFG